jgi:sec-independent protein translocase protein TatC
MSEKPSEPTSGFLSHLIELRDRLLRAVITVGVIFVVLFPFASKIYDWLAAPLIDQGQKMIITGTIAPFLIPMKLTLLVAFLIALPYLLYQLWSFVAPGLYKHEKRLVYPLLASSVFLFYLGILFVYYILLPMMFQIIPQFAPSAADYSPDIAQYLDFTMMMFLAFGFGFEMPIATILLISTGMTTAKDLKRKRPYVIVGAFVLGMLLTPPDVVSQVMLAIPMWLLFELGIFLSRFFDVRIKEASKAREEMDNSNGDASNRTAAAASGASALSAEELWQDDDYIYEEENSILDSDSNSNQDPDDQDSEDDDDDFKPLSEEEMDAELDRIEAEEHAEDEQHKNNTNKPEK